MNIIRPRPRRRERRHAGPVQVARLVSALGAPRIRLTQAHFREFTAWHARYVRLRSRSHAELGLTHARMRILECLYETPGWCMSDIARRLDLARQSVHRVVHAMERAGLVALRPLNGRAKTPMLTLLGRLLAEFGMENDSMWWSRLLRMSPTVDFALTTHRWETWRRDLPRVLEDPAGDALHAPPYDDIYPPAWIRNKPWDR
jgi:DNA-binding MarR family transcriptional regulator